MLKVIIAGSRNTKITVEDIVKRLTRLGINPPITIISGGADGPDTVAIEFAKQLQLPFELHKAEWDDITVPGAVIKTHKITGKQYNKAAGIMRNKKMGDLADLLIAFWDGKSPGTRHMIDYMKSLGKPVNVLICCPDEE